MSERLFAIGDIHGCLSALKELVENELQLTKSDTLVFLGDYIDRGARSKEVVDYIMLLKNTNYNIITIKGNHEVMLLDSFENDDNLPMWLYNGGNRTLLSFGVTSPHDIDSTYINFFRNMLNYFTSDEFLFVHAGFNDSAEDPFSDTFAMAWQCRKKYKHPELKDKTIIHGHCVSTNKQLTKRIAADKKVISIDTGCVYGQSSGYGSLTAIELPSKRIYSVQCK